MTDASLPLQKAIVDRLKATGAVSTLVGARVYDFVPTAAAKPYLSLGPFDVLTEKADEYEGSDTTLQIDGWSAGGASVGSVEVKRIGRAVRAALHQAELTLNEDQRLVSLEVDQVRYLIEPDGITQHVVVTVRARTEPSA